MKAVFSREVGVFVGDDVFFEWSGTLWLGVSDSVNAVWPLVTVQACMIRLIRGTFRYA